MSILKDENKVWTVSTEGDCEGRSIQTLGTFKGSIIDIATKLRGKEAYALNFTEFKLSEFPELTEYQSNKKTVTISVNGLKKEELQREADTNGVNTKQNSIYGAIELELSDEILNKLKKEQALSKLTGEEKRLLGLN